MEAFYNLSSSEEPQLRKRKAKMKLHLPVTPRNLYPAPKETFLHSPRFLLWRMSPFCPLKRPAVRAPAPQPRPLRGQGVRRVFVGGSH